MRKNMTPTISTTNKKMTEIKPIQIPSIVQKGPSTCIKYDYSIPPSVVEFILKQMK